MVFFSLLNYNDDDCVCVVFVESIEIETILSCNRRFFFIFFLCRTSKLCPRVFCTSGFTSFGVAGWETTLFMTRLI